MHWIKYKPNPNSETNFQLTHEDYKKFCFVGCQDGSFWVVDKDTLENIRLHQTDFQKAIDWFNNEFTGNLADNIQAA